MTFANNTLNNEKLISAINTNIIIKDSKFVSNEGSTIVTSKYGTLQIEDSVFQGNRIKQACNCIEVDSQLLLVMDNVTAEGNYANLNGGFACISNSDIKISYSIFKSKLFKLIKNAKLSVLVKAMQQKGISVYLK